MPVRDKSGIALITTLMIVALVVAVVVEFSRATVAEIEVSKNFSDEKKITYIAISGIAAVKDLLMIEGKFSKADSLLEDWAKSRVYFDSASAALEEGKLQGSIWDEESRINVNRLVSEKGGFDETQKKIWERLLKQTRFGLTSDQAASIIPSFSSWQRPRVQRSKVLGPGSEFGFQNLVLLLGSYDFYFRFILCFVLPSRPGSSRCIQAGTL